jgi:hypothetical protein
MQVRLIDLGNGFFPNLALMKVSAFHKALDDEVIFPSLIQYYPELFTAGKDDLTYISCVFSRHRKAAETLMYLHPNSVVGGPGWDPLVTLPSEIEGCRPDYSLYGLNYGLGRLTAGCPGDCPWCVVPASEGTVTRTVAEVGDIANGNFLVLLDANILASSDWPDHLREIRERKLEVHFTQGLDIRLVTDLAARELASLKIRNLHQTNNQIYFAWDKPEIEDHVRAGVSTLVRAGIKPYRLRFYVLCGHSTTWEHDWHRFAVLHELGIEPFIMLYKGAGPKLRAFARWVNRMIYRSCKWEDYERWGAGKDGQLEFAI